MDLIKLNNLVNTHKENRVLKTIEFSKKLKIGTQLTYIGKTTAFEKKGHIYGIIDIVKDSKRPFEVSCEVGNHNWWSDPSCSWTLKELNNNFIINK